jgi:hypothetical protein
VRLILDGIAGLKFLLEGDFLDFTAVIEAHLYFYRNLPKLRQKRKEIKQTDVGGIYQGNIVFAHYLFGKKKFSELEPGKFS